MVGIVIIRARHSAKIREKSHFVSEKTIVITAHLCSETAVFAQIATFRQALSVRYSRTEYAVWF
jgi:hypothetical protein